MSKNMLIIEDVLHKPNQLIGLKGSYISSLSLLTYNFILNKIQKEKKSLIKFSISELAQKIDRNTHCYEDVYMVFKNLLELKVFSMDKKGKSWGGFSLISAFKKENDFIFVEVPSLILNELVNQKELYYTTIKLLEERTFKCVYSIIFYEIFKKYKDTEKKKVNIPTYTLEDLKELTETTNKYKTYYDFKRRVLNPALAEINQLDDTYIYSIKEEYLGRKVHKIKFIKTLKEIKEIEEPQLFLTDNSSKTISSENLLLAIEKVKKNIHIARKFSKRAVNNAIKQYGEEIVIAGLERMSTYNFPIDKFANFLTSTLSEVKKEKEVKRTPAPTIKKEEKVVPPASIVKKIKKTELSELDQLKSDICNQAREQLGATEVLLNLFNEIVMTSSKEEVLLLIKKYDLEINLNLFSKN